MTTAFLRWNRKLIRQCYSQGEGYQAWRRTRRWAPGRNVCPTSLSPSPCDPHPVLIPPHALLLHTGANTIPMSPSTWSCPITGNLWCVPIPEMVAAVSSASRRSFSSRSFSSSRWCCRCRSSIFFWCVSSMAAKPLSHVACKRDEGKGLAGVTAVVSPPETAHQQAGWHPGSIMGIFSLPNHGGAGRGWTLRGQSLSCQLEP